MRSALPLKRFFSMVALLMGALALSACGALPGGEQPQEQTQEQEETQEEQAAKAAVPTTPRPARGAAATPTPGAQGNVEISPNEATVGVATLALTLEPARHMFDYASFATTDPAQQAEGEAREQTKGSVVFGEGMLRVTNNIDASQAPPSDSAEGTIRHVVVRVKHTDSGQAVPYLSVSVDVLRDGRPVLIDQGLAPMAAVDQDSQLYYGNNIKFSGPGRYQLFVRVQPHPLFGQEVPPAAQFNLTFR